MSQVQIGCGPKVRQVGSNLPNTSTDDQQLQLLSVGSEGNCGKVVARILTLLSKLT